MNTNNNYEVIIEFQGFDTDECREETMSLALYMFPKNRGVINHYKDNRYRIETEYVSRPLKEVFTRRLADAPVPEGISLITMTCADRHDEIWSIGKELTLTIEFEQ